MNKITLALIAGIIAFTLTSTATAKVKAKSNTFAIGIGIGSLYGTGIQPGSVFIEGISTSWGMGGGMHTDFRTYGSAYFLYDIRDKKQWSFPITMGMGFTQESIVNYIGAHEVNNQLISGDTYERKDTLGVLLDIGFGASYTFKRGFYLSARIFVGMAAFNTTREADSYDDALENGSNNYWDDGCKGTSGCEANDTVAKAYGGTYLMIGYEF